MWQLQLDLSFFLYPKTRCILHHQIKAIRARPLSRQGTVFLTPLRVGMLTRQGDGSFLRQISGCKELLKGQCDICETRARTAIWWVLKDPLVEVRSQQPYWVFSRETSTCLLHPAWTPPRGVRWTLLVPSRYPCQEWSETSWQRAFYKPPLRAKPQIWACLPPLIW